MIIKNVISIDFEKNEVQTVTEWTKEQKLAYDRFINYFAEMYIKYYAYLHEDNEEKKE